MSVLWHRVHTHYWNIEYILTEIHTNLIPNERKKVPERIFWLQGAVIIHFGGFKPCSWACSELQATDLLQQQLCPC